MESRGESSELQQLVSSDADGENEDSILPHDARISEGKVVSPERSTKISSSGNTSHSSVSRSRNTAAGLNSGSRILFINEKRPHKEPNKTTTTTTTTTTSTARPRNVHKAPNSKIVRHHSFSEVPDVRHMERALLGLLDDFHSGKLRAFGSGCNMEQMTNIREQQEKLAKLHFDLGAANDPSLTDEALKQSQNTMSQLIQRLEQLSVSIEGLHSNKDK